jgi:hypothetical protein
MPVCVMHVRQVRVRMPYRLVLVKMGVRLAGRVRSAVRVAMVLVVHVRVGVCDRPMNVFVLVMLGQVQPHADRHQ